MTQDNLNTMRMYQYTYFDSIGVAMIELELIDLATEHMGFDDMIQARQLMDEKIPVWK